MSRLFSLDKYKCKNTNGWFKEQKTTAPISEWCWIHVTSWSIFVTEVSWCGTINTLHGHILKLCPLTISGNPCCSQRRYTEVLARWLNSCSPKQACNFVELVVFPICLSAQMFLLRSHLKKSFYPALDQIFYLTYLTTAGRVWAVA